MFVKSFIFIMHIKLNGVYSFKTNRIFILYFVIVATTPHVTCKYITKILDIIMKSKFFIYDTLMYKFSLI